jgi:hypothetical protein
MSTLAALVSAKLSLIFLGDGFDSHKPCWLGASLARRANQRRRPFLGIQAVFHSSSMVGTSRAGNGNLGINFMKSITYSDHATALTDLPDIDHKSETGHSLEVKPCEPIEQKTHDQRNAHIDDIAVITHS